MANHGIWGGYIDGLLDIYIEMSENNERRLKVKGITLK